MSFGPPKGKYVKAKRAPVVEAEEEETGFRGYTAQFQLFEVQSHTYG